MPQKRLSTLKIKGHVSGSGWSRTGPDRPQWPGELNEAIEELMERLNAAFPQTRRHAGLSVRKHRPPRSSILTSPALCVSRMEDSKGQSIITLRLIRLCVAWLIVQRSLSWLGLQAGQLRVFAFGSDLTNAPAISFQFSRVAARPTAGRYNFNHTVNSKLKPAPSTPNRRFVQVSSSPRGKQRVLLGLAFWPSRATNNFPYNQARLLWSSCLVTWPSVLS